MAYYDFLNIIFGPLLRMPPLLSIITLAFAISFIIIIVTKYTTDQALMKRLKEEQKNYQKQIKELKSEPAKAMELQKKSMETNMKYMMHSLKPTIITFIPIILIFGWMSSTFAYESIKPQQEFSVTVFFDENTNGKVELIAPEDIELVDNKIKEIEDGKVTWILKGNEGEYVLEFVHNNETQQKDVLITRSNEYIESTKKINRGAIKSIQVNHKKLVILPIGYKDWLGWLGTYLWSSILFTIVLRKLMKVY
ncbi:DUF106 domain-containing protein [Candidatus Woesearchaeota archaeon]|nr:DUF106 domain-containing protein [Candidatus Woesearchaeota archaeon]